MGQVFKHFNLWGPSHFKQPQLLKANDNVLVDGGLNIILRHMVFIIYSNSNIKCTFKVYHSYICQIYTHVELSICMYFIHIFVDTTVL